MFTFISNRIDSSTRAAKLLSTKNGRIKLETLDDVRIYAHTQGIIYYKYSKRSQLTKYYIQLAELMRSENRNRWATDCYIKALWSAWSDYVDILTLDTNKSLDECIAPHDIYKTARLYLLGIDNTAGLKRLKAKQDLHRAYFYKVRKRVLSQRYSTITKNIEEFLDKNTDPNPDY